MYKVDKSVLRTDSTPVGLPLESNGTSIAVSIKTGEAVRAVMVDCVAWLTALGITFNDDIPARLGPHWLSLFSLVARLDPASYVKKRE